MDDCLFCKIIKKEIPCYQIYEDDNFLAFLDVYPVVKGHILLIPKTHYKWTYDVPNFGEYWEVAKKIGLHAQHKLQTKWINFLTHGAVPHAHIHILPRAEDISKSEVAPKELKEKTDFESLVELLKIK